MTARRVSARVRVVARSPWTQLTLAFAVTAATAYICLPGITATYIGGPISP